MIHTNIVVLFLILPPSLPQLDSMSAVLWKMSGNLGDRWLVGQVEVTSTTQPYQMVFEAVVGGGQLSDMAIDDVTYTAGPCLGSGR